MRSLSEVELDFSILNTTPSFHSSAPMSGNSVIRSSKADPAITPDIGVPTGGRSVQERNYHACPPLKLLWRAVPCYDLASTCIRAWCV